MGGSIGFTIRETSGKEHRMCRWTNILPSFFKNVDFINKSQQHIEDNLVRWYEMVDDYKNHIEKGTPIEHNMTEVYAPYPFLAPEEYGLVVADYKTNTLLDAQNYTAVNKLDFIHVVMHSNSQIIDGEEELDSIKKLFDENKIISYKYKFKIITDPKKLTFDYIMKHIKKIHESSRWGYFKFDMQPWTVFEYDPHRKKSMQKMKKHILKLGFELTEKENEIWEEWFKRYEEDDA